MSSPDSDKPRSSKNSFFSSSSNSAISCSICAQITKTPEPSLAAYSLTFATYSLLAASSAKSSSETFAAYITGLYVKRLKLSNSSSSSSSSGSYVFARFPSSRCFFNFSTRLNSLTSVLSFLTLFASFAYLRSNISRSENKSSKLIVSISRSGSMLPST